MGGGTWTKTAYSTYATSTGRTFDITTGVCTDSLSNQEIYKARYLDEALNPLNVVRECVDSAEHPNTIPVILALDVTGSMGNAAVEVSQKLNQIMTKLYDTLTDVEFMIMGIGDLAYDRAPIQATQFESDIRIAEQLDKLYFEFGGGGNYYESYSAAWYFGLNNTKLDCFDKRHKKAIIITMGDERLNPVLGYQKLNSALGSHEQTDVETSPLYYKAAQKFDIYHIDVTHGTRWDNEVDQSWKILGENYKKCSLDNIASTIVEIITNNYTAQGQAGKANFDINTEISW